MEILFPKAYVPNDEIPRPTRPELFKGWLIEERVVEKQSGYVPYNEHFALILSDNVGGHRVPGFLAVARYEKDYDGTSRGATEQLRVKKNNIVHPVPDDIQRASMSSYRMDWPPSDATDLMMHMYTRANCNSIMGDCSPWSLFRTRSEGFVEYETLGVERAVQKAVRKFMIRHGLSPETVYGWGSRGRSDTQEVTPNGNTVAEQGVKD